MTIILKATKKVTDFIKKLNSINTISGQHVENHQHLWLFTPICTKVDYREPVFLVTVLNFHEYNGSLEPIL